MGAGSMNNNLILSTVAAGLLMSGCATGKSSMVLDAVGPVPARCEAVNTTDGTLVVYSAYETNADSTMLDPDRPEYSDYDILTAGGKLLRRVHNNSGTVLQDAVPVRLPAGHYRVVARTNGCGVVTIPVVIGVRQETVLHLDGDSAWPDKSAFNAANAVRLPDGQIVGWKAASSL